MKLYRLSRDIYARDLTGTGARLNGGRWNSKGRPAVYTAEHISLAKLEVAVHLDMDIIPENYYLIEINLPDVLDIKCLQVSDLPHSWDSIPYSYSSQSVGDSFLNNAKYVALKAPSAIIHQEFNYILNPHHPDFNLIKITKVETFSFDQRLFKSNL
mgnify:CR=1 FL=1